jgi:peptidoglycan/LPS O-acetylase OafA/YrhL
MNPSPGASPENRSAEARLVWIDRLKGVGLIWVFLNHLSERMLGGPLIGNPFPGWPPLEARVRQLAPLTGHGFGDLPLNLFRYIGWSGDNGVGVFLLAAGFGLTWGLLGSGVRPWSDFYRRRVLRIYPSWLLLHALVFAAGLIGLFALDANFLLSAIGLRVTSASLYLYVPAWWFITLLLQLYAVFPLLWGALRRWGPWTFFAASTLLGFFARGVGLAGFEDYLDPWLRGGVFITRLPEFALGMALAAAFRSAPVLIDARLRSWRGVAVAALLFVVGCGLALTWWGMIAAPLALTAGACGLLYPLLARPSGFKRDLLAWTGAHSLSLYLVHHPVIAFVASKEPAVFSAFVIARMGLALGVTVVAGIAFESVFVVYGAARRRWGTGGLLRRAALGAAAIYLGLVGATLLARALDPGEIFGWGERESLEPDDQLGWRLRPDRTTRLRWDGYDYVVTANSLGFPGPEVPRERTPGSRRILVTGDAFTSAEGVDTGQSWPRLLEQRLQARQPDRKIEVLNFGITGYGPNQYATIVERYAPLYRPDLVLVEMYVNESEDVLIPNETFRQGIGFGRPPSDGLLATLTLRHLHSWAKRNVGAPLLSRIKKQPDGALVWLRGGPYVLVNERPLWTEGMKGCADRLGRIKRACDAVGARLELVLVPAAVQVCGPERRECFPAYFDPKESSAYDLERPQRDYREMARALGVDAIDLREPLRSAGRCVHWARNMHWTRDGHEIVATYLAEHLPAPASPR